MDPKLQSKSVPASLNDSVTSREARAFVQSILANDKELESMIVVQSPKRPQVMATAAAKHADNYIREFEAQRFEIAEELPLPEFVLLSRVLPAGQHGKYFVEFSRKWIAIWSDHIPVAKIFTSDDPGVQVYSQVLSDRGFQMAVVSAPKHMQSK